MFSTGFHSLKKNPNSSPDNIVFQQLIVFMVVLMGMLLIVIRKNEAIFRESLIVFCFDLSYPSCIQMHLSAPTSGTQEL